jgi:phosphoserine phosphatase RsbU/P
MARRVVAPLRTLEVAALRAASGAYVRPIEAKREDELGQVAKAFNAVALRLNALHDLSQLLASSSQLDQVLDGILSAMGHIVGPGVAAIYLLDETGRWLVPVRARGADISLAPAIDSTSDMWLARAMDDTAPAAFVEHGRSLAEELPGLVLEETAALVAPLVVGRETLGVVVVLNESDSEVSEAELEMVRTFSAQAAVAVNNSRLFAFESESRRVAEGLRTVGEQLVRPGGLAEALADVEISVAGLFNANRASFALVDRSALGLAPAADRGTETETLGYALRLLGRTEAQRPIVVRPGDDSAADAAMARFGSAELIVVPIALDTEHGAVLVIALGEQRASRRDLDLADAVANEIALSLGNSYFYEQALIRANSLETVFRISQAVGSSLDVKVVLNRLLDVVQKILSADAVALMTYDARRKTIATEMARGRVSPSIIERVFKSGDDVVGYVFASGEPVAFRDLHEGMEGVSGDAARNGLHSMLAVPLLARGRSIGVLTVFSAGEGAFNDDDMSMLQTFASQAALAIDTARLYSREHDVATLLQQSILPGALPEFAGIDAASAYEPAGGDTEIGGDYYDLFRAPDESLWLAIADVCGKGVRAATKTSMIKYSVRSLVAAGFSPRRVVTEVNRMVAEGRDPSDIVTLWVGRVDLLGESLTWSSGGHPPGMLRQGPDGGIVRLAANGPLLGAVAEVDYPEESVRFAPGDTVLLYTDGVTEARSGNRFFGEERVEEALSPGGTAAEVVDRLQASVRRFVQAALRDDVAVLAVRLLVEGTDDGTGL